MKDEYAERRAVRSVYVSNIPNDMHEAKMKEIFSTVGPVSSFRIINDHDTKRSRGYGYCEFMDKETALIAILNLGGYEINGRPLVVETANNEKCIKEIQAIIDEEAPETISKAVASLPPDQMFELMRQIKQCIENNAEDARAMLINNPPLTYALLEAQLVMGIVDLQEAWALIEAAPVQRQDVIEAPQIPPAPALRTSPAITFAEAREAEESLISESRNPATDVNRHSLMESFTTDQSSRDSRTMDSNTIEQHSKLSQDPRTMDYNSDSRSMDDAIIDPHPHSDTHSRDIHPLAPDTRNVDLHSADSHSVDQSSLGHIADSHADNPLSMDQHGTDSHSRDSFPLNSRPHSIDSQHIDSHMGDLQPLDRRSVDPRVVDRHHVDPRIPDRLNVDARIADRPPIDSRIVDQHSADSRIMEPSSQDVRTVDSRSLDPRSMDPRALYSRPADPRIGERRMDPRMGDWRLMDTHTADPNSIDSDIAELHFDPRPPSSHFDHHSVDTRIIDPRTMHPHLPDSRSLNPRSLGPRMMDPRAINSRPSDPYFPDPRDPRSRGTHEMEPSLGDPRAQGPRLSHMSQDFRVTDNSRGYAAELHTRDPRLVSRSVPQPHQPLHQLKDRPAQVASGFTRSTASPHPSLAPSGPSHSEPVNASVTAATTSDEEKAALIMQVLQLSDEQIAALSPEQQQSILVLKEQIAKSSLQ